MEFMAQRNAPLALLLGTAQLVGGDCFEALWWLCPANSERGAVGFVTLLNDHNPVTEQTMRPPTVTHVRVLLSRYITLAPGTQYKLLLWDGVASLCALSPAVDAAALASREIDIVLGPGDTKLLCFAPKATASSLLRWTGGDDCCTDSAAWLHEFGTAGTGAKRAPWSRLVFSALGLFVALVWTLQVKSIGE